jgi:hypothetical protein
MSLACQGSATAPGRASRLCRNSAGGQAEGTFKFSAVIALCPFAHVFSVRAGPTCAETFAAIAFGSVLRVWKQPR